MIFNKFFLYLCRFVFVAICLVSPITTFAARMDGGSVSGERFHNSVGIFVGATNGPEFTDFTYGVEYSRIFNHRIGMKALLEHTPTSEEGKGDLVSAVLFIARVYQGFVACVGPGFKHFFHETTEPLMRFEFFYVVDLPHQFEFMPDFALDLIRHNRPDKEFGVVFAKRF